MSETLYRFIPADGVLPSRYEPVNMILVKLIFTDYELAEIMSYEEYTKFRKNDIIAHCSDRIIEWSKSINQDDPNTPIVLKKLKIILYDPDAEIKSEWDKIEGKECVAWRII